MADLTHDELLERIERRVCGAEGQGHRAFLLREICVSNRRADAISVGLWHSRGQLIEGFEAKASREDWLREYEDHQKAEPAMAVCDYFWLATNPGVLQPNELPEKWGLLLSNGKGRHLKVEKPAPLLREKTTHPVSREVLVGLLRGVGCLDAEDREAVRKEGEEIGKSRADLDYELFESRAERAEKQLREREETHRKFLERAGLDFYGWSEGNEEAMKLLGMVAGAIRDGERGLERLHNELRRMESTGGDLVGKLNDAMQVVNDHIFGKGQAV
jgi:hypothetical protein